jgi:hypothetical protein
MALWAERMKMTTTIKARKGGRERKNREKGSVRGRRPKPGLYTFTLN